MFSFCSPWVKGQKSSRKAKIYTLDLLERLHKGLRDFGQTKDELFWRIDALLRELAKSEPARG